MQNYNRDMKLGFTGERYVPEQKGNIQLEHLHRYAVAYECVKGKAVLDIACGEGYGSMLLSYNASHVIGVDISKEVIDFARAKYHKDNIDFKTGTCDKIPLEDSSIDVVVSFETIEHHDQHEAMMREIKRVLKKDGVLIISSPDKHEYSDIPAYENPFHKKELCKGEFKSLLEDYFINVSIYGQRAVYGSGIFAERQKSRTITYDIKELEKLSIEKARLDGLARPLYFIAMASDSELPEAVSSLAELPLNESELFINFSHEFTAEIARLKKDSIDLANTITQKLNELDTIYASHSWRYTAPLRKIGSFIRQMKTRARLSASLMARIVPLRKNTGTKNEPIISVVIPIYDRTDVLKRAIESILNQSFQDFELLLVCDGSPPETLKVVEDYQSNPKVRILRYKDNSGNAIRGRNRAILRARGKYLAFLDSDDIAEPGRLETSYRAAERYKADLVYGACRIKKGRESINPVVSNGQVLFDNNCDYEYMLKGNPIIQSTVMAKTDSLRRAGGFRSEMQYCEDYELWLRMANLGCKFTPIPDVLVTLRIHNQNLEDKFRDKQKVWQQKALSIHKTVPKMKPSIAFVIPGEGLSGGIMVVCQHANMLIQKGYDVVLINHNTKDPFKLDWFPDLLAPVVPINKHMLTTEIIIATQWSTAFTALKLNAKRRLYFVQSDETRFSPPDSAESRFARRTYTFDFEFVVIAKWLKRWLKDKFNKDSDYVPNGLDASLFYPDEPLVPKNNKLRVLLEGPIDIPFKGMKEAFEVVDGIDCEVWCVSSSGKPKPDWHCDRFFERVPLKDMRKIYCSCDVLIKMTKVEGFFMPPLEMMACGGTVITNKVTGYDEYIKDGYNGLVVEQGDVASAREKLNLLIQDRSLLEKLKKGGMETAKKWTWEESNKQFEKILEENLAL